MLATVLAGAALAEERPRDFAARHVLVAWKGAERSAATRTKEEARARAEEALAAARKPGADLAEVSRAYSDDVASDAEGGFLGVYERGVLTPVFERALEDLPVGGLSGVVESPFGFHVILRLSVPEGVEWTARYRASLDVAIFSWKGIEPPPGMRAPPSGRTRDEALADARRAVEGLRGGRSFGDLPPALGAVPLQPGWRFHLRRGGAREAFRALEEAAFALPPGLVSEPVASPIGWIVARRLPHFRARVRHLVVVHSESERRPRGISRSREEARARAQEALARLRADPAAWTPVLEAYTDEIGGVAREGALGVVEPGTVVPAFEDAVRATATGAFSEVFETPFGYHVLQRLE